jgi:hypothetical protein
MAYEMKDNTGSIFINDKKESERHPDRKRSILVDGRAYWLSGWLKKTKDGKPYLSLSIKPRDGQASKSDDDPIPF